MKKTTSKFINLSWQKFLIILTAMISTLLKNPQKLFAVTGTPDIFGTIAPPPGVDVYQSKIEAAGGQIGIVLFLSNAIRLITVAAGIWVMFNIISAGWTYINSAGDSGATEKVASKITNSVIGLAVVALAYTIAGAIGYFLFGDAGFILNPELFSIID